MSDSERTAAEIQAEMDVPSHPVYTFPIDDFKAGVISKSAVVRHFQKLNPGLKVTGVGTFKIQHEEETISIELKTVKNMAQATDTTGLILPDPDEIKKLQDRCDLAVASCRKLQARVEEFEKALSDAQHFWKEDDLDNMEVALYRCDNFMGKQLAVEKDAAELGLEVPEPDDSDEDSV